MENNYTDQELMQIIKKGFYKEVLQLTLVALVIGLSVGFAVTLVSRAADTNVYEQVLAD